MNTRTNFTCTLLLFSTVLSAQPWQPVLPDEHSYFIQNGAVLPAHSIQVRQVSNGPDGSKVYDLNRVVTDCDTCQMPAKLREQGQFLQEKVIVRINGSVLFSGKKPFVLYPQALPGFEWLLDTLAFVRARIASTYAGIVLGEPDSLKDIVLSDGGRFTLSRTHGIVHFPARAGHTALDLAGMKFRQLGTALPDWLDFHNFEVGDIFQRRYENTIVPGEWGRSLKVEKTRVLARFFDLDTLKYRVLRQQRSWLEWSGPPRIAYRRDTLVWRIHASTAPVWTVGGYPGQWVYPLEEETSPLSSRLRYAQDSVYGAVWALGEGETPFPACHVYYAEGNALVLPCDNCYTYGHAYAPGLGRTYFERSCFEVIERETLEGFVKQGDTTGVIWADSILNLTFTREPDFAVRIRPFPNPGRDIFTFNSNIAIQEPLLLRIFDTKGQLLWQNLWPLGTQTLDIDSSAWPPGVYHAVCSGRQVQAALRLVKM